VKLQKDICKIGLSVLVVILLGFAGNVYFTINEVKEINLPRVFLSLMMVVAGLITFFGFISLGIKKGDENLSKTEIRLAIVVSVMTMYLLLVGTVSFFAQGGDLPIITDTMIGHFTTIVGVVIAFYFGTAAYEAVYGSNDKPDGDPKEREKVDNKGEQ